MIGHRGGGDLSDACTGRAVQQRPATPRKLLGAGLYQRLHSGLLSAHRSHTAYDNQCPEEVSASSEAIQCVPAMCQTLVQIPRAEP